MSQDHINEKFIKWTGINSTKNRAKLLSLLPELSTTHEYIQLLNEIEELNKQLQKAKKPFEIKSIFDIIGKKYKSFFLFYNENHELEHNEDIISAQNQIRRILRSYQP